MKDTDSLSDLDISVLDGIKLGIFEDFFGQHILYLYQKGIIDSYVAGCIKQRVNKAKYQLAFNGLPFLPPKLHNGDFFFGKDLSNNNIKTILQYFNAHTLICAGTGAGKTNLCKYHAVFIAPKVRGLWLVDLRKKEFRILRPIFELMGIDLKIIRGRKFRINPLEVPFGVEPVEYASIAAEFIERVLNLPHRSSVLLKSTIIKLYTENGILNGGQKFPTLFHLFEAIKTDRNANSQAKQTILDNLEMLLLALGPEVLAYHKGWSINELANQHLVIELTGLPEAAKDLILNYLITAEFISRISRGISNPLMDLWISFDEGQRLFSQKKETSTHGGNSLIDLTGLVRGTGIGLEVSVLTTNDLSNNIPNLTSTKIIGRCGSVTEYTAAGRFMGLNSEQIQWCAHHLVPGIFVGQVGEGTYRYPFLFRVPLLGSNNFYDIQDYEADSSINNLKVAKVLPASI